MESYKTSLSERYRRFPGILLFFYLIIVLFTNEAIADLSIPRSNEPFFQDTWFFTAPRDFDLSEEEALSLAQAIIPFEGYEIRLLYYLRTVHFIDEAESETAFWTVAANPVGNRFDGYYFRIYSPKGTDDFDEVKSRRSSIPNVFDPPVSSDVASAILMDYIIAQQPYILPVILEKTYHRFIPWSGYTIVRAESLTKLEVYLQSHIYYISSGTDETASESDAILVNPFFERQFILFVTPDQTDQTWKFEIAGFQNYLYNEANEVSLPIYETIKLPWSVKWESGDIQSLLEK